MQETNEKLPLNLSTGNGVVSQYPVISGGLLAPYHQQRHDINNMLQNQMTIELSKQLKFVEQREFFCMQIKEKALEEEKRKSGEMEIRLRKALAEAEFWKKLAEQKIALTRDLAGRLIEVRKKELSTQMVAERKYADDAQSSTGENGDDNVDTATTRRSKRRRCL